MPTRQKMPLPAKKASKRTSGHETIITIDSKSKIEFSNGRVLDAETVITFLGDIFFFHEYDFKIAVDRLADLVIKIVSEKKFAPLLNSIHDEVSTLKNLRDNLRYLAESISD
jgi:hypothetical protein